VQHKQSRRVGFNVPVSTYGWNGQWTGLQSHRLMWCDHCVDLSIMVKTIKSHTATVNTVNLRSSRHTAHNSSDFYTSGICEWQQITAGNTYTFQTAVLQRISKTNLYGLDFYTLSSNRHNTNGRVWPIWTLDIGAYRNIGESVSLRHRYRCYNDKSNTNNGQA